MSKRIVTTSHFDRQLTKLVKKGLYSQQQFVSDIKTYFANEQDASFRKHKISGYKRTVRSVTLGYDLRTLYFLELEKPDAVTEYIFFDIGDHDHIYQ